MRLDEMRFPGGRPVDGYGPGFFRVAGAVHRGAVLVLPSGVQPWAGPAAGDAAAALVAAAPEVDVVFLGTGPEIAPLPAALRTALEDAGLGVEIMNTPAACRSFNVCLAEGRRVAAALVPV
jgi:uncharacterized protein